ncbi:MAG: signal peptidase II [Anaerolineales bacterium]|nr:signal peptidase II [Anaerolineales bacterium]
MTRKNYSVLLVAVTLIVAFDQWTKWLVRKNLSHNTSWLPESLSWLSPYARITYIQNKGASFGMFQDGKIVLSILAVLIIIGAIYYVVTMDFVDDWTMAAAGLYIGGAVGNLIDRLTIGSVTDFVSVGTFYIFNVADASINVSVAMLILIVFIHERRKPNMSTPTEGEIS